MPEPGQTPNLEVDRRWPRAVYGVGSEPDPRFTFANERTFLAWIRTALGFIAAGVAIAALGPLSDDLAAEARIGSIALAGCGLLAGASSWMQWVRNERALRTSRPLPSSPVMPVLVVVLIGIAALVLALAVFQ